MSVNSFLLETMNGLLIHVIYFKMDLTVCLFFPIGKEEHKPIYLCYLFQNGSNYLFILSYWKDSTCVHLFMLFISKLILLSLYSFLLERKYTSLFIYVIYFKMDQTVCLFFPIGKEIHKHIYLCDLIQNGTIYLLILA